MTKNIWPFDSYFVLLRENTLWLANSLKLLCVVVWCRVYCKWQDVHPLTDGAEFSTWQKTWGGLGHTGDKRIRLSVWHNHHFSFSDCTIISKAPENPVLFPPKKRATNFNLSLIIWLFAVLQWFKFLHAWSNSQATVGEECPDTYPLIGKARSWNPSWRRWKDIMANRSGKHCMKK